MHSELIPSGRSPELGMPSGELWMPLGWAQSSWPGARPVDTCALAVSVHWTDHQLPAPGELVDLVPLAQLTMSTFASYQRARLRGSRQ